INVSGMCTRPGSDVVIEGGAATSHAIFPGRHFFLQVSLVLDQVNHLFVTEFRQDGVVSPPVPLDVIQDSEAPFVIIDFPPAGETITTSSIDVSGRVSDRHSGFQGLAVDVNGIPAIVDVGIGTNGTFVVPSVPLGGSGTIDLVATSRDAV